MYKKHVPHFQSKDYYLKRRKGSFLRLSNSRYFVYSARSVRLRLLQGTCDVEPLTFISLNKRKMTKLFM